MAKGTRQTPSVDIEVNAEVNAVPSDMQEALDAAAAKTASHIYNPRTQVNYAGYIQRGKTYLEHFNDGKYSQAFDVLSVQTPTALLAYAAFKCEITKFSFKTAEAIQSALKRYFRDELGCQGEFWRQDSNGQWIGNPVFEQAFPTTSSL
ncbi:hypothetical protein BGZ65_011608 [Modicella reniformis]|uniref:Uncharacterized protein n=1 Tax=Modicella reniformis TaxID=1440133 RepID=A0A9P6J6M8_9FUNG|nr:hypothetical protein BGZ65_011608 [Modicella reniformis]